MLATSLSAGARFLTVWHSVAQLRRHYGPEAAAEILVLCQGKVFLARSPTNHTPDYIVELLGPPPAPAKHRRLRPGRHDRQARQRTTNGERLRINGARPPTFFRQRRHYLDRGLRQLRGEPTNG